MSEKVVARFNDGRIIKGYLKDFSVDNEVLILQEAEKKKKHSIPVEDLKALFFVRSFEGDSEYRERKAYGIRKSTGRKVYVKFKDGESMTGFLEGDFPWDKGFFLRKQGEENKGFFMIPTDSESNNIKIFVVGASVRDITSIP
jgi:small nuclear ribonucleoprotein (snRNP)-like protein